MLIQYTGSREQGAFLDEMQFSNFPCAPHLQCLCFCRGGRQFFNVLKIFPLPLPCIPSSHPFPNVLLWFPLLSVITYYTSQCCEFFSYFSWFLPACEPHSPPSLLLPPKDFAPPLHPAPGFPPPFTGNVHVVVSQPMK